MLKTRVFELARAQGRTKTWLARQYGISYSYLWRLETGDRRIPEWFVEKSCAIFGLPADMLFFDQSVPDDTKAVAECTPEPAGAVR